jgi:hypothetical protein
MYNLIQNQNMYANQIYFILWKYLFIYYVHRSNTFKYIYQQESSNDVTSLLPILPCFGLFSHEPLGLYHGILRFSSNSYSFYLIGSKSPLYKSVLNSVWDIMCSLTNLSNSFLFCIIVLCLWLTSCKIIDGSSLFISSKIRIFSISGFISSTLSNIYK